MKVSEILRSKGASVVTLSPRASVRDLVSLLDERNIGAVVVSEPGSTSVVGIVSERDVVRHLAKSADVLDLRVADIMTSVVASATGDEAVDAVAERMTDKRIRHLPVLDGGELVGIVSIGDIVKSRIGELEFQRAQLESYVSQ